MKLTAREKRSILVAICVAVAVLIYFGIALLLPAGKDLSQRVAAKKSMLIRQRQALGRQGIYQDRLEQFGKRLDLSRTRLLPGDNPNVAAAELQRILKDFADQCGVEITQKSILPEEKVEDLLIKVSVKINTNCSLDQLVRFLTAIENYEKNLKIEEFVITSFKIQKRSEIRPILTVTGFISSPEAKS